MSTDFTLNLEAALASQVPYFAEWLGLWLIEDQAREILVQQVNRLDLAQHLQTVRGSAAPTSQRADEKSVAVIRLNGPLQKHQSSMSSASSTVLARRDIRAAARDPEIGSILLSIESPGGTAAGTYELYQEIRSAGAVKPVHAHITDIGASAAYWAAVGAQHISANKPAQVGSIGTYTAVLDSSHAAEQAGIRVHVIRAGAYKGLGIPGTQITESQLEYLQQNINQINNMFLAGVSEGRRKPLQVIESMADGRVYLADTALSMGMIDQVSTFEEAFEQARDAAGKQLSKSKRGPKMSDTTTPVIASAQDIRRACPNASAEFILSCIEGNKTIEQAVQGYATELANDNAKLSGQIEELQGKLTAVTKERDEAIVARDEAIKAKESAGTGLPVGTRPLKSTGDDTPAASASEEYWAKVKELQLAGKNRQEALSTVNRLEPQLREAMVEEQNQKNRRRS